MISLRAALAAAALCMGSHHASSHVAEPLTLDDAFQRVIDTHPDLAALRLAQDALDADVERAALPPPLSLQASVENVLGTGQTAGLGGSEVTLSLASVIERGNQRGARVALAERRREEVELSRQGKRLDLLADVARRYLDAVSADQLVQLLREDLVQRERLVDTTSRRVRAGADSLATQLAATAARQRVATELARTERQARHARRRLALLWGDTQARFRVLPIDFARLPTLPDYDQLVTQLATTPELRRFAHASRVREAQLQLARSSRALDLDWQVGIRRLQAESDWALVGSVSIPFGRAARAAPDIRAAEAELAAVEFEHEGQHRALQSTLAEAWSQLDLAVSTVRQIDAELLPTLHRATEAAAQAYRAGAIGNLEWAQLQSEVTAARRERLDAGVMAHRALIELQRLTGESFRFAAGPDLESTP